jgi:TonB-dependent starch-binding outer membrane protein SusC
MKNLVTFLFLFLFLICSFSLKAQTINISGKVTDENNDPFPGVTVMVKGSSTGASTDTNGIYSLTTENDSNLVLTFSFFGFEEKSVIVANRTSIDIMLEPISSALDELVVVGYGSTKYKELTGATARVKGEDIEKLHLSRMDQALQGQVAGVSINTNSGSPGGSSSIRIRGLSTFGDNDPLILVDGVVYDSEGLNALNPSDIKSVNVLKDATAGIYGVRAANGVIIVETKNGQLNTKPRIEFNSYYGVQQTARKLELLNANEYAVIKNEMFAAGNDAMPFNNTDLGVGTNWQDTIFQSAPVESYGVSISGGSQATKYSLGLTYFSQDGIVGGDKAKFSRYNGRLNLSTDLAKKLKLNSVLLFSHDYRTGLPENGIGSVLYNTINAFPNEPVRTPNGNYSYLEEVSDIINPVAQIENTFNYNWANKFVGKEELVYSINDQFSFTNRFNYNYAIVDSKVFSPLAWYGTGKYANTALNEDLDPTLVEIGDGVFIERGASVYEQRATYLDLTYESYLNYENTFKDIHKVKGTLGVSAFHRKGEALSGTAFNIPNNSIEYADISANTAAGGYLNGTGSWEFTERLLSSFLRLEYGYDSRYLISAIVRRDGSSKFGPNKRYGFFPTASAAWLISDESFYNVSFIDFLKLRLSYGVSGNDQISNFAYRALLNGEGVYVFDDVITTGVAIGRAGNPDLKWETTRQFNVGIDMTLLSKIDFTVNYFIKNTFDLLFQPDVSAIIGSYGPGGYPPIVNAGDVSNKGLELELGYSTDPSKAFTIGANLNFTMVNNKVTSVPDGVDYLPGAYFGVGGNVATRFEENYPIGYFHGFQTNGIYQTQEEIDAATVYQEGAQPGDLIFIDQNGDGVISFNDDSDRTMIGSAIPDFTMGLALNMRFKGFDFSSNIYATYGQEIIRNFERNQPYANQMAYMIDRWVGPGTSTTVPRVTTDATRNTVLSDYYVEDGSFIRLRNIQLGYTIPKKFTEKLKVESFRLYVSANNLVTLTKYQGFDPDIGPTAGTLSAGVDYGFYPQARTIMGGLTVKF